MTTRLLPVSLATAFAAAATGYAFHSNSGDDTTPKANFADPVRLTSEGAPIATEAPGYASPAWYDVNGDGRADLIVGQFNGGKMRAYHQAEDGTFGAGSWIQAEGEVAEVPGVW